MQLITHQSHIDQLPASDLKAHIQNRFDQLSEDTDVPPNLMLMVEKAGIEGITAHCLRRTAASLLINSGRGLTEVMKLLRNSSPLVTERHYTRLSSRNLAEASDTISKQLLRAASGEK